MIKLVEHREMSERLMVQSWKGCVGLYSTGGSNPPLSEFIINKDIMDSNPQNEVLLFGSRVRELSAEA